jgi:hypothetical protein
MAAFDACGREGFTRAVTRAERVFRNSSLEKMDTLNLNAEVLHHALIE